MYDNTVVPGNSGLTREEEASRMPGVVVHVSKKNTQQRDRQTSLRRSSAHHFVLSLSKSTSGVEYGYAYTCTKAPARVETGVRTIIQSYKLNGAC